MSELYLKGCPVEVGRFPLVLSFLRARLWIPGGAYQRGRHPSAAGAPASRRSARHDGWRPAARTRRHKCARLCHTRCVSNGSGTRRARTPDCPRTASPGGDHRARPHWRRTLGSSCRGPVHIPQDSEGSDSATRRSAQDTAPPGAPGPAQTQPAWPAWPAWRGAARASASRRTGGARPAGTPRPGRFRRTLAGNAKRAWCGD